MSIEDLILEEFVDSLPAFHQKVLDRRLKKETLFKIARRLDRSRSTICRALRFMQKKWLS